jgi:hypothetical protein
MASGQIVGKMDTQKSRNVPLHVAKARALLEHRARAEWEQWLAARSLV